MLVGHYAPALALRRVAPTVPLWLLFVAAQAVDLGFFTLVFAGVESGTMHPGEAPRFVVTHGVWSHSLLMTLVYGAAVVVGGWSLGRLREGAVLGIAVASHWLGDALVHAPDLPVAFDQSRAIGLSLWSYPWLALALELGLTLGAGWWWLSSLKGRARRRARTLLGALVVTQLLGDFVVPLPPTDVRLGVSALGLYAAMGFAAWWTERAPRRD